MIPNNDPTLYALYVVNSTSADGEWPGDLDDLFHTYRLEPVVAWSDDGDALVMSPRGARLLPATHYLNGCKVSHVEGAAYTFDSLEQVDPATAHEHKQKHNRALFLARRAAA